jgi:hypothetical protein
MISRTYQDLGRFSKIRQKKLYTMEEIRLLIQASDKELEDALKQQRILEYKGMSHS